MTSQPGLQTMAIHLLPNISQSNKGNIFLQKLCGKSENEAGRLVPDLFLFFEKA